MSTISGPRPCTMNWLYTKVVIQRNSKFEKVGKTLKKDKTRRSRYGGDIQALYKWIQMENDTITKIKQNPVIIIIKIIPIIHDFMKHFDI